MPDTDGCATSLEMVADYECLDCGPIADMDLTEDQATDIFGGDASGALRCPNDWCGEEIGLTADARLANLEWLARRRPDMFAVPSSLLDNPEADRG